MAFNKIYLNICFVVVSFVLLGEVFPDLLGLLKGANNLKINI